jgi:hypothetical protein
VFSAVDVIVRPESGYSILFKVAARSHVVETSSRSLVAGVGKQRQGLHTLRQHQRYVLGLAQAGGRGDVGLIIQHTGFTGTGFKHDQHAPAARNDSFTLKCFDRAVPCYYLSTARLT